MGPAIDQIDSDYEEAEKIEDIKESPIM